MDDTQVTAPDAPATDTAATQNNEASTNTNEAPNANQGDANQDNSQTDVSATDTAEEKLLAGKYKTVEDLEKSYIELQSKFGQTTNEKAELARILNQAFEQPPAQQQQVQQPQESYDEEPDPQIQRLDSLERQTAVQSFILAHPDANSSSMQKVLAEDPIVRQINGHQAKLEYAYLRSQNMSQSKAIEEAKQSGANAATAKIAEKQAAQVESAKRSEPIDESADLRNRIASNDPDVRKAARREYIRKNLVNI